MYLEDKLIKKLDSTTKNKLKKVLQSNAEDVEEEFFAVIDDYIYDHNLEDIGIDVESLDMDYLIEYFTLKESSKRLNESESKYMLLTSERKGVYAGYDSLRVLWEEAFEIFRKTPSLNNAYIRIIYNNGKREFYEDEDDINSFLRSYGSGGFSNFKFDIEHDKISAIAFCTDDFSVLIASPEDFDVYDEDDEPVNIEDIAPKFGGIKKLKAYGFYVQKFLSQYFKYS